MVVQPFAHLLISFCVRYAKFFFNASHKKVHFTLPEKTDFHQFTKILDTDKNFINEGGCGCCFKGGNTIEVANRSVVVLKSVEQVKSKAK